MVDQQNNYYLKSIFRVYHLDLKKEEVTYTFMHVKTITKREEVLNPILNAQTINIWPLSPDQAFANQFPAGKINVNRDESQVQIILN